MKGVNGFLLTSLLGVGILTNAYTGQEKLDEAQQIAVSYSEKAESAVELIQSLKAERNALANQVSELQNELDRNWNTVEEVNALIEETKVLRHQIALLEEQLANSESYQAVEQANQSAENHLEQIKSTLDESIFDGIVQ